MPTRLSDITGDGHFVPLDKIDIANVYLKLESLNPAGSIKFKTALGRIDSFEVVNAITADTILLESSSGNLGVALSVICAERGYRFTCIVDPNTNPSNIRYMRALGAEVVLVSWKDENGGYLGSRIGYIRELTARDWRYLWVNQYENPANPAVHAETTARAIDRAFDRLDYVFIGTGTAGTLMGCVRHLSRARPRTRIVAVDSVGSVTFGLPPGPRYIPGLGSSQSPKLFRPNGIHALVTVPEAAAISTCRYLARTQGILAGGSTGTALAGLSALRRRLSPADVVVVLSPDSGERYLDTIYNDDWVESRFGSYALSGTLDNPALRQCVVSPPELADRLELHHL